METSRAKRNEGILEYATPLPSDWKDEREVILAIDWYARGLGLELIIKTENQIKGLVLGFIIDNSTPTEGIRT